jgi:TetR/AcrR family transcriptional regulator
MMIWAMTQHYADFDAQVQAVLGADAAPARRYKSAEETMTTVLLEGLRPR